jgi:[lysine-biosynthesis-protein LysW]--L-2-aminoadipate ligase
MVAPRIAFLHTLIRPEEKLLLSALERRGVDVVCVHVNKLVLDVCSPTPPPVFDGCQLVIDRCVSASKSAVLLRCLESWGLRCVNSSATAQAAGDKITTHRLLAQAGVPTPRGMVSFDPGPAREALEAFGYPAVIKPAQGSWGRLLARINDSDAAEAVLEHKATLGNHEHAIIYAQEYVEKQGFDLRVFVAGDEVLCAIERRSEHWITNTARGATTANHPVGPELEALCLATTRAMGGGLLAIDVFVTADGSLLVNEVNHSMEFRNSIAPTGVDIPERIVDYLLAAAAGTGGATRPTPVTTLVPGPASALGAPSSLATAPAPALTAAPTAEAAPC